MPHQQNTIFVLFQIFHEHSVLFMWQFPPGFKNFSHIISIISVTTRRNRTLAYLLFETCYSK